jgi:hypothetical protein
MDVCLEKSFENGVRESFEEKRKHRRALRVGEWKAMKWFSLFHSCFADEKLDESIPQIQCAGKSFHNSFSIRNRNESSPQAFSPLGSFFSAFASTSAKSNKSRITKIEL